MSVTGLFIKLFIIICFDDKMVAKSQIDSLPAFRYLLADDTFLFLNPILPVLYSPSVSRMLSSTSCLSFAFAYDCYALFYCHIQLLCFKVNTSEKRQIHQLALFVGVVWIHGLVKTER